jgi:hypothetical protein
LLSNEWVCEVSLANHIHSVLENLFELSLEEFWLNFCNFIKLDQSIL